MKIFTIGYGGRSPQELVSLLTENGVRTVADVRLRPDRASMGTYVKAKSPEQGIQKLMASRGVCYASLPELGNVFMAHDDWQARYTKLIERAGDLLTEGLTKLDGPLCLLCAEKRAAECHRMQIANYLLSKGHEIVHIE